MSEGTTKRPFAVAAVSLLIGLAVTMLFAINVSRFKPLLKRDLYRALGRRVELPPLMRLPVSKTPDPHIYPASASAHNDLDHALADSLADRKRILVVFGANWCADCQALEGAMQTNALAVLVATNYHVVHVNVDEGKSNTDLASRLEVPLEKGIPALAVLDSSGQLITSQRNGEFHKSLLAWTAGVFRAGVFFLGLRPVVQSVTPLALTPYCPENGHPVICR